MRDEVCRTLQSFKLWDAAYVETEGGEAVRRPPEYHIGYSSEEVQEEPRLPWEDSDSPEKKFEQVL